MTTEPDWLNPCEPTDPELLDALKAETNRRTEEFMQLRNSAPDLLEALNRMLVKFESEITAEYEGTALLSERLKEADFARAAIAKAEGRDA